MTGTAIPFSRTVHMNGRDISQWCEEVEWGQPNRYLEREFEITTHAWHRFVENARYDIYASYDPNNPYAECVIRNGWLLPDKRCSVKLARGKVPKIKIMGKSWSSVSFRRAPRETLILAPIGAYDFGYLRRVLDGYDGVVGRVRMLVGMKRVDQAVVRLGMEAWLGVSWNLPTYPIGPVILPPGKSYWDAMLNLAEPFAPEIVYNEFGNSVVFADSVSRWYGSGDQIYLGGNIVESVSAIPLKQARINRVIVKAASWH